ncbi:MAG: hypothetical protein VYA35_03150, partial [Pseudomonadota bacterium]|nr:hypothetical protein [Pseudomonadota bacterium]
MIKSTHPGDKGPPGTGKGVIIVTLRNAATNSLKASIQRIPARPFRHGLVCAHALEWEAMSDEYAFLKMLRSRIVHDG